MTVVQMECFVEAAKRLNFTKAADALYISQQTMSRQIKALETELGFPVFERKNVGVRLTAAGSILYHEWEELLERYRSSVDRANDEYHGEMKQIRIGVSDMGNIVRKVTRALSDFNEKYPDLDVEYEVGPYPAMREKLEQKKLHMIITFGAEILHEPELQMVRVSDTGFRVGIVMGKHHPLSRKKNLSADDIQYETIAVLSDQLSHDHQERITNWFCRNGITHPVHIKAFHSFYNLQIALSTGKCVAVMYERILDGVEDKLAFFPLDDPDTDGAEVVIAWKNKKYGTKAKNIAYLMEQQKI